MFRGPVQTSRILVGSTSLIEEKFSNLDWTDYLVTFMSGVNGHDERAHGTTSGVRASLTHKIFLVRSFRLQGQYWFPIILNLRICACYNILPEGERTYFLNSMQLCIYLTVWHPSAHFPPLPTRPFSIHIPSLVLCHMLETVFTWVWLVLNYW